MQVSKLLAPKISITTPCCLLFSLHFTFLIKNDDFWDSYKYKGPIWFLILRHTLNSLQVPRSGWIHVRNFWERTKAWSELSECPRVSLGRRGEGKREKDREGWGGAVKVTRVLTRSASPEQSTLGKERAYPPALEEVQRRSHVGQPVDPSELAAVLTRLRRGRGERRGGGYGERTKEGRWKNKEREHFKSDTFGTKTCSTLRVCD